MKNSLAHFVDQHAFAPPFGYYNAGAAGGVVARELSQAGLRVS
jgi:hypothetical protein